jgi:ankyrin repeat protein
LVTEGKADVDKTTDDGFTPLYMAAELGHTDIAALLVKGGADINIAFKGKFTPLFKAKKHGHQAIVALLEQYR